MPMEKLDDDVIKKINSYWEDKSNTEYRNLKGIVTA